MTQQLNSDKLNSWVESSELCIECNVPLIVKDVTQTGFLTLYACPECGFHYESAGDNVLNQL